jgi:hypothetical protein
VTSPDAVERLRETFKAAQDFGLSDEDVWATVLEVVDKTPPGRPAAESMAEVADALAKRIEDRRGE